MAAAKGFEEQSAALDRLREQSAELAQTALRKALQQRNNFLVAKAARIAGELRLTSLTAELASAFLRFMPESGDDPVKTDPQCWAKNDIGKTLAAFEYQEHELFLVGMRHHQMEPVWGGRSDTAGALRGTCALALVQCRQVNSTRLLGWLTELFADEDSTVRVNAARAVEQVGSDAAMLLLKLRAELASDSAELLGACYGGVLRLEGPSAIPWAARFLSAADDGAAEAALAIAETRTPQAFDLLKSTFDGKRALMDPWFRGALLSAIALTRQQAATDWLLGQIENGGRDGAEAHDALCGSAPTNAVLQQLKKLRRPCPAA
ncbi:MAG TPA: hypothetical protein VF865_20480 [Acidobacteriaceae bacterium]